MERLIVNLSSFENSQKQSQVPSKKVITWNSLSAFFTETMKGQKRQQLQTLFLGIKALEKETDKTVALDKAFQTYASARHLPFKAFQDVSAHIPLKGRANSGARHTQLLRTPVGEV